MAKNSQKFSIALCPIHHVAAQSPRDLTTAMGTSTVQIVLEMGFERDKVTKVVGDRLRENREHRLLWSTLAFLFRR